MQERVFARVRRWVRNNHGWTLPLTRGVLNTSAVALALRQAAHPATAALVMALTAGLQSALLQWSPVNARYARFLNGAPNEPSRFLRWALVSSSYYTIMQLAGLLVTRAHLEPLLTLGLALRTSALGAAQYPWVAAIARRRLRDERRARRPADDIRFVADLQTMLVSAAFVALSALGAIGFGPSRWLLLAAGLVGLGCYLSLKARRRPGPFSRFAPEASSFTMRALEG